MKFLEPEINCIELEIPFFNFPVQAGFPSPADDYTCEKIDLNKHIIKHHAATFFVRVAGDSMKGKGIYAGDLVVVDRSLDPIDGNIVIAFLNSEFTIKEFKKINSMVILKSANEKYPDILVKDTDDFEIWGVVKNIIRDL